METVLAALGMMAHGALVASLVMAAATDLARREIPNGCCVAVAVSGAVRAMACALGQGSATSPLLVSPLARALLGGVCALAVMLVAAWASARVGEGPGVGGGDVKLVAAAGVWAGPLGGLAMIAGACVLGLLGHAVVLAAARLARVWHGREGASRPGAPSADARVGASGGIALAPAVAASTLGVFMLGPVLCL